MLPQLLAPPKRCQLISIARAVRDVHLLSPYTWTPQVQDLPLLSRVSGSVAKAMVRWRKANGAFKDRQQLMQVTGLDTKTFEQSTGFLRIRGGGNPLDMTGVHPETYSVVENIIGHIRTPASGLQGGAFIDLGVHQDGLVHVSQPCEGSAGDPWGSGMRTVRPGFRGFRGKRDFFTGHCGQKPANSPNRLLVMLPGYKKICPTRCVTLFYI